ncbi:MAG: UvrD-helicase domain-containing protein [Clostridia bacterium]|nr:UvrD-helicase domain-containing protein [Clostridia bacterium]MDD4685964.1 UvrD-helicase domain-containing protein [Clostridia bacterium]
MSSINFLPEQIKILESKDKNVIVSASAGSGKTTVMIQKLINLIVENNVNVKNLLVLTYTRSAAEEMKQKLLDALFEKAKTNPALLNQIDDVETSDISTIHSFFQKLIKKYFNVLDIDPNFSVLEEKQSEAFKHKALKEAIAKFGETNPLDLSKLLDIYGKTRTEKTIYFLLDKINIFLSAVDDPDFWSKNIAIKSCEEDLNKNYALEVVNQSFYQTAQHYIKVFNKTLKQAEQCGAVKYIEYINNILSQLEIIKPNKLKNEKNQKKYRGSFFDNFSALSQFSFKNLYNNENLPDLYNLLAKQRDDLKNYINKATKDDYSKENVELSLKSVKDIINILLELNKVYEVEYSSLKKTVNALDFNDLEKMALELSQNEEISNQISNRYSNIYVDEYQDANRLQEKILSAFVKKNNRFMVGDVKQSIYGFRQAEPDIFLDMQKQFCNSEDSEVMYLNSNFRSHKKILNFVNLVFNTIMTQGTAKLDYKNTAQLQSRLEFQEDESSDSPRVELNIIKNSPEETNPPASKIYSVKEHSCVVLSDENPEREAILIAKKISELVGKKYFHISSKTFKEIEFKDISILLNSRSSYLDRFCTVLSNYNIPVCANTNSSLLNDEEVNIFVCLLKLCKNFNDDISLAVCLKNEILGGLSFKQLGQIRLNALHINKEQKLNYFYECVNCYNENDEILCKINNLKSLIEQLKFDIKIKGIYFALSRIVYENDYYLYLFSKNNGNEKVNNVQKFLRDFNGSEYNFNLIAFLNFIEQSPDGIKAPNYISGDNCVNVTTIHSSKGLEYPVVILANVGAEFTGKHRNGEIEINLNQGIALKFYNNETRVKSMPVMFDAMIKINKSAEFAEKLRLLYVALTRAKNYLIIVGSTEEDITSLTTDFEIQQKNSFLELIAGALPENEIDKINKGENIKNENYSVKIFNELEITRENVKEKTDLFGKSNKDYVKIFENYFNLKAPLKKDIALKNSVTSLARENMELDYASINHIPKILKTSEHLSEKPSETGTLYHKVFELLDFEKINSLKDIEQFLAIKFSKEANILNINKIYQSVCCLKKIKYRNILKEQKFMMYIPHKEIVENGSKEKILIQGIVDLILLGEKNILIDYKYTSLTNEEEIIKRYSMQLKIYKRATETALNNKIDCVYILLINSGKLIEIMV